MRNRAQCRNCKDIIESCTQHDWVCCSCFSNAGTNPGIAVDGGPEYFKRMGNPDNFIEVP